MKYRNGFIAGLSGLIVSTLVSIEIVGGLKYILEFLPIIAVAVVLSFLIGVFLKTNNVIWLVLIGLAVALTCCLLVASYAAATI